MVAVAILSGGFSAVAWYLSMFAVLTVVLACAPKSWRKDQRALAALSVLAVGAAVGAVMDTVIICPYQGTAFEWLCYIF